MGSKPFVAFLACSFKKSVKTAVLDDASAPGALVLTRRLEYSRENGSVRNQVLHKFGRKYAAQKLPKTGHGASRHALFWAPARS